MLVRTYAFAALGFAGALATTIALTMAPPASAQPSPYGQPVATHPLILPGNLVQPDPIVFPQHRPLPRPLAPTAPTAPLAASVAPLTAALQVPAPLAPVANVQGQSPRPALQFTPGGSARNANGANAELEALRALALEGQPQAQYALGVRYELGMGVPANIVEATAWYGLSANAGFAPAQYRLGMQREFGVGLARDLNLALGWYMMADQHGYPAAKSALARFGR